MMRYARITGGLHALFLDRVRVSIGRTTPLARSIKRARDFERPTGFAGLGFIAL